MPARLTPRPSETHVSEKPIYEIACSLRHASQKWNVETRAGSIPHLPMSSFHRSGCSAMKLRISAMDSGSSKTLTLTPFWANNSSAP